MRHVESLLDRPFGTTGSATNGTCRRRTVLDRHFEQAAQYAPEDFLDSEDLLRSGLRAPVWNT